MDAEDMLARLKNEAASLKADANITPTQLINALNQWERENASQWLATAVHRARSGHRG